MKYIILIVMGAILTVVYLMNNKGSPMLECDGKLVFSYSNPPTCLKIYKLTK